MNQAEHECGMIARAARVACVGVVVILPLTGVIAQPNTPNNNDPTKIEAPQPRPPTKAAGTVVGMLSAMFLGAVVIGVNFIPSKRGHQD